MTELAYEVPQIPSFTSLPSPTDSLTLRSPSLHNFTIPMSDSRAWDLPECDGDRVLLVNPPVYDTRLHWHQWQQPTLLLRLGGHLRQQGVDVKLLDVLHRAPDERLPRTRVALLSVDELSVPKWRYGPTKAWIGRQLRDLNKSGWQPDQIYVECSAPLWWEGAREVIEMSKRQFPRARAVVLGAYATQALEHATEHSLADEVITQPWPGLSTIPTDLSLYREPPAFACILLGRPTRTAEEVVDEVSQKAAEHKVRRFVIADHAVVRSYRDLFPKVLEALACANLKVAFCALGNVTAADFVANPQLPALMRSANFAQIYFADDRDTAPGAGSDQCLVDAYRKAAELCHEAGYPARKEKLNATLCIGRPGEHLESRARVATQLAHHVGSVVMVPYQPLPGQLPFLRLEDQNGKLFPFRKQNGVTYRDYLDLMGLAVVLNAKYRSRSFDFMGDGLIPSLFRDSIRRRGWDPDPEVKGSLKLPLVVR